MTLDRTPIRVRFETQLDPDLWGSLEEVTRHIAAGAGDRWLAEKTAAVVELLNEDMTAVIDSGTWTLLPAYTKEPL